MKRKGHGSVDIVVLGGGSFGTALASLLADIGRRVRLWVRREEQAKEINQEHRNSRFFPDVELPRSLQATADLEEAVRAAPVLLVVVPSRSFREVASRMGPFVQGDQIVVHATKGIEVDTFKRMSEILREETCALKIGVLSGPNLAGEVMARHPGGALVASRYQEVVDRIQELFRSDRLRVYGGRDVVGTELGGAFKNIIAIAAGAVDGMGFGDNTKAALMTRGLAEITRLGVRLGADPLTFAGLTGLGDLIVTCTSMHSRNRRAGMAIGRGATLEQALGEVRMVVEGVRTTVAAYRLAARHAVSMPITEQIYRVLFEDLPPRAAVANLMTRTRTQEMEDVARRVEWRLLD